jgi:hypothetical protein
MAQARMFASLLFGLRATDTARVDECWTRAATNMRGVMV